MMVRRKKVRSKDPESGLLKMRQCRKKRYPHQFAGEVINDDPRANLE